MGAVATYVLIYGASGWLAENLGHETTAGRAFGFVSGALSPLAFGIVAIPALAIVWFVLLTRFAFRSRANAA